MNPMDRSILDEYGAYVQLQKSLLNDVLKLTAAGRYDKNENFEGRFTPRITATIRLQKIIIYAYLISRLTVFQIIRINT